MNIKNNKHCIKSIVNLAEWAFLVFVFIYLINHVFLWLDTYIDCDMASLMVQDNLLFNEGAIASTNWYYSSELTIFGTQLIFSPLFLFFQNWTTVRFVGYVILYFLLLCGVIFMLKQFKIHHVALYSSLCLAPFSTDYFCYVLAGCQYISYIIIFLFIIGLLINYLQSHKIVPLVIMLTLTLLNGLNGIRQIYMLNIPLLITSVVLTFIYRSNSQKNSKFIRNFWIATIFSLIASAIGYLCNVVILSKVFSFAKNGYGNSLIIQNYSTTRMELFINSLLASFGFRNGYSLFSLHGIIYNTFFAIIFTLTCIFIIIILNKKRDDNITEKFLVIYFLSGLLFIMLTVVFTNITFTSRYLLSHTILFIPILAIGIKFANIKQIRWCLIGGLSTFVILLNIFTFHPMQSSNYMDWRNESEKIDLQKIIKILDDNNYQNGYSSTENACIITERTNGKIDVWNYGLTKGGLRTDQMAKWFQKKSHMTEKPKDKVFVLLTTSQDNDTHFNNKKLVKELYRSEQHVVYIFNNVDELEENLIQNTNTHDLNDHGLN